MKAFFLIAVILFACQAVPGNAQSDPNSILCYRSGGFCRSVCPLPFVNDGICGTGNCCKRPPQGPA